jgi:hypothetical protein
LSLPVVMLTSLLVGVSSQTSFAADPSGPGALYELDRNGSSFKGLEAVRQVAGGAGSAKFAITDDGRVFSWGVQNSFRELGLDVPAGTLVNVPTEIPGLTSVTKVSASGVHGVALREDGTVWGWGLSAEGNLGLGGPSQAVSPQPITNLVGIVDVAAVDLTTYALQSDGTLLALGQLDFRGNDLPASSSITVEVMTNVARLGHGAATYSPAMFVVKTDGTVWGWGGSTDLLGTSGTISVNDYVNTPVQVPGISESVDVSYTGEHVLVVHRDGTVRAWGSNSNGQLGLDVSVGSSSTPVTVPSLSGVKTVVASRQQSYALKTGGTLWTWGDEGAFNSSIRRYSDLLFVSIDSKGSTKLIGATVASGCPRDAISEYGQLVLTAAPLFYWDLDSGETGPVANTALSGPCVRATIGEGAVAGPGVADNGPRRGYQASGSGPIVNVTDSRLAPILSMGWWMGFPTDTVESTQEILNLHSDRLTVGLSSSSAKFDTVTVRHRECGADTSIAAMTAQLEAPLNDGRFHHFAVRAANDRTELAIDGEVVAASTSALDIVACAGVTPSVVISGSAGSALDEPAVFNNSLTEDQIRILGTLGCPGFVPRIDGQPEAQVCGTTSTRSEIRDISGRCLQPVASPESIPANRRLMAGSCNVNKAKWTVLERGNGTLAYSDIGSASWCLLSVDSRVELGDCAISGATYPNFDGVIGHFFRVRGDGRVEIRAGKLVTGAMCLEATTGGDVASTPCENEAGTLGNGWQVDIPEGVPAVGDSIPGDAKLL